MININLKKLQWCSQGLPGWATRQNEEENEKRLKKNRKKLQNSV